MKLPSVRQAAHEAGKTFVRFPAVIVDAALGTAAALILVDYEGPPGPTILFNVLLAAILGIPLLTGLTLLAERKRWAMPAAMGTQAVGVLLLVGYAFSVPSDLTNAPAITIIRFFVLASALHLFVALAPYSGTGELNGFWHYNKTLFLRLLIAFVYSLVLYVGLTIALAALNNLFGVNIPAKRYGELFVFISGVVTTWIFLSGVPSDMAQLNSVTEYPKGLKVFAQYILFPIVLVYMVILYAYMAKILVAWDWPQGWVSKLILGFSGTGIFSLLLLYPVARHTENIWIRKAERWFYMIVIPLVVMLFFAVWRRVSEYGFTEGRYCAIAVGIWLIFIALYFIFITKENIKVIPASLCIIALVVSVGPWGMFGVAEQSQIARLEVLLQRNAILKDGKVHQRLERGTFDEAREISAILSYLHDVHGYEGIQRWFGESLKQDSISTGAAYKKPDQVAQMMGFEYVTGWQRISEGMAFLYAEGNGVFEITGYDRLTHAPKIVKGNSRKELPREGIFYQMSENMDTLLFSAVRDGKERELLRIDLGQHVEKLLKEYGTSIGAGISAEKMAVTGSGGGLNVKVCFWQIQVQLHGAQAKPTMYNADILYSVERGK